MSILPRVGKNWKICPPSALEIALGLCPQAIFQGCKLPLGAYFPIHPSFQQCINPVLISRKNSLAAHQALIQVLCTGIRSTTFSGVRCGIKFLTFLLICHVQKPSQKVRGAVPYQFCIFCLCKEIFLDDFSIRQNCGFCSNRILHYFTMCVSMYVTGNTSQVISII